MPLIKKCSMDAFRKNVETEKKPGKPPSDQALAIAYSVLKKACGVESKKKMTPTQIIKKGGGKLECEEPKKIELYELRIMTMNDKILDVE